MALSTVQSNDWADLEVEVHNDDKLRKVMQDLMLNPDSHPGFH